MNTTDPNRNLDISGETLRYASEDFKNVKADQVNEVIGQWKKHIVSGGDIGMAFGPEVVDRLNKCTPENRELNHATLLHIGYLIGRRSFETQARKERRAA